MKLNMKGLCRAFEAAEEEETTPRGEVNSYLLEKVLWPTMEENAPRLEEIDYDQFEAEDISALEEYCELLTHTSGRLMQFVGAVAKIQAIPCRSRQFC